MARVAWRAVWVAAAVLGTTAASAAPAAATPIPPLYVSVVATINLSPPDPIYGPFTGGLMTFFHDPDGDGTLDTFCTASFSSPLTTSGVYYPPNPCLPQDPMLPSDPMRLTLTGRAGAAATGTHPAYGFEFFDPAFPDPGAAPVIVLSSFANGALPGTSWTMSGPIVAYSTATQIGTWEVTATVVTPVPEPGTLMLVGAGALAGFVRLRSRPGRR